MSLPFFLDTTVKVKRLSDSTGMKRVYAYVSTIQTHIQDIDEEKTQESYGSYVATHRAWVEPSAHVEAGDQWSANGKNFEVVNVLNRNYGFAINTHYEIILKELVDNE